MSAKIVFVIAALAFISAASATLVHTCGSSPAPINVDIKNCEKEPCRLPDGTDAIMDVTFNSLMDSETLVPKVRAKVGPITVTYPLPEELQDGCNSLLNNGTCPLVKGEERVYRLAMPISGFPKVAVNIEFSLLGDDKEVLQCFKVDCVVVEAE